MTNLLIQFMHTTAAYQAAVAQLLIGEANFTAEQLHLTGWQRIESTNYAAVHVGPPPLGVDGVVENSQWIMRFEGGTLTSVFREQRAREPGKNWPDPTELLKLRSLIDTNEARLLVVEWLSRLGVNTNLLVEKDSWRITQRKRLDTNSTLGSTNYILLPDIYANWASGMNGKRMDSEVLARLRGDTKELWSLRLPSASYRTRPKLALTNASELLGPLPPPRNFVEDLFGGAERYRVVATAERVEVELLDQPAEPPFTTTQIRRGPLKVIGAQATKLSATMLDFGSYMWTARKLCIPNYGARVRFIRGVAKVEVLLCFECDELLIDGKFEENFDFAHNDLLVLMRELFPRDSKLAKLEFNQEKREDFYRSIERTTK